MKLKTGKTYITRGEWEALIIWRSAQKSEHVSTDMGYYAIHKPGTNDESNPTWHNKDGEVAGCAFAVNLAPTYGGHPADIVREKKWAKKE